LDDAVLTTLDYLSGSPHFDLATQTYTIRDSHVHCEALLLRHHMLNPDLTPFNYFGVSKLCCYPCHALFSPHNTSVGPEETKYFAKGCHNKLHPLWSIPDFSEPKDSQIRFHLVQEHFAVELTELSRDKRNIRAGSDSTDASGGSADAATSKSIVDFGTYCIPCYDMMAVLSHLYHADAIQAYLAAVRNSQSENLQVASRAVHIILDPALLRRRRSASAAVVENPTTI
jgi:hypothetical protein